MGEAGRFALFDGTADRAVSIINSDRVHECWQRATLASATKIIDKFKLMGFRRWFLVSLGNSSPRLKIELLNRINSHLALRYSNLICLSVKRSQDSVVEKDLP